MDWRRWVFVPYLLLGIVLFLGRSAGASPIAEPVISYWWTVPLLASASLTFCLGSAAVMMRYVKVRVFGFSTFLSMVLGPSIVAVNIVPMLVPGLRPPGWAVGSMMLALICSALLYCQIEKTSTRVRKGD